MPLPAAPALTVTPAQRVELRRITRYPGTPQAIVLRCRVVLAASLGTANRVLARQLSTSVPTVLLWRRRFMEHGLLGILEDKSRPGRPRSLTLEKEAAIVEATASGKNLSDQFISVNQYDYDIDKITVTGLNVGLTSGPTYWLNLQNAVVPSGNPVYWDENSGIGCGGDNGEGGGCPSVASSGGVGTDPSESFTITGGSTPEPSSFMLFGSGILSIAGVLRRKLF
jgi:hypothetical protein